MNLFELFTKYFFGKRDNISEDIKIVDGIVINPFDSSVIETLDESYTEELDVRDENEVLLEGFADALKTDNKSQRTIKEYCYDIKAFGNPVELNDLSKNQIIEKLNKVSGQTARRKLSSLNSFAKWRVKSGETKLYLTLVFVDAPKTK